MSRVHTFLVILLVLTVASVVHLISVAVFPPMDDSLQHENEGTFNAEEVRSDIYLTLSVYVPLIMSLGAIVWGAVREYRRQRDTAVRVVGRP